MSMLIADVNTFWEGAHKHLKHHRGMLAKRIRSARVAAGLSQSALARARLKQFLTFVVSALILQSQYSKTTGEKQC